MPCDAAVQPVLEVDGLEVAREGGFRASLPSLRLRPGSVAALHGPSGCGKSTLLLALFGLLGPGWRTSGTVRLDGAAFGAAPDRERRRLLRETVAYVMQDAPSALDPLLPVGEQLAQATGRPASECAAALAEMGIEEAPALSRRLPHEISTGQAQRVLLAAALLRAPRLIVADEPSASLDGGSFAELVRWLRRLCEQSGTALLLATHDRRLLGELQAEVFACRDGVFEPGPTDATPWPVRPRGDGAEGAPVLAARGLGVRLGGRQVLQDIDLEIRRGEVVALLGESGSGKTTLARVLCGHRRPDAGGVQAPARKTAVQLLFQDALASMTPGRSLGGLLRETSGPGFDAAATAARLGLRDGQLQRTVAELSGGERRRAALLRALSVDPELLALDEPTVSLDRRAAVAVMATTFEVQRQRGLSLLLITHDEELAAASADRVLRLQGGRLCS